MQDKLDELLRLRQDCYKERYRCDDLIQQQKWSDKAKEYTPEIKSLRKDLSVIEFIQNRSEELNKTINAKEARENEL